VVKIDLEAVGAMLDEMLAVPSRSPFEELEPAHDFMPVPGAAVTVIRVVRFEAMTETPRQHDPEQFLTLAEVAAWFQISRSTAYRLKKKQAWPAIASARRSALVRKTSRQSRRSTRSLSLLRSVVGAPESGLERIGPAPDDIVATF